MSLLAYVDMNTFDSPISMWFLAIQDVKKPSAKIILMDDYWFGSNLISQWIFFASKSKCGKLFVVIMATRGKSSLIWSTGEPADQLVSCFAIKLMKQGKFPPIVLPSYILGKHNLFKLWSEASVICRTLVGRCICAECPAFWRTRW